MKPVQSLLFLLAVGLGTLVLGSLFPEDRTFGEWKIRFFRWDQIFRTPAPVPDPPKLDLNALEARTNQILAASGDSAATPFPDSSLAWHPGDSQSVSFSEHAFHLDSASGIQYPGGDSTLLFGFFRDLDSARFGNKPIRILHFGDSQIEGDRISAYLRQRLQQEYGGSGPGLIPFFEEEASRMAVRTEGKPSLLRYSLLGKGPAGPHRRFGLAHQYFLHPPDSTGSEAPSFRIRYRLTGASGYRRAGYFERATLLFRTPRGPGELKWGSREANARTVRFAPSDSLRWENWESATPEKEIYLRWNGTPGGEFLGICLDGKFGVAVDNLPLRGSSGLEFHKFQPSFLQEQIRRLKTRLIILQFGVNVVPYDSPNFSWYETSLVRIIQTLKRSAPGIPVLVLGVSDMAKKIDGTWQTYPNIPAVKAAQRNACLRTQSAFWDVQQVMGGPNSILAWAKTDPPLAASDYIHLSPKGAQVLGEFFYQALMRERTRYRRGQSSAFTPLP